VTLRRCRARRAEARAASAAGADAAAGDVQAGQEREGKLRRERALLEEMLGRATRKLAALGEAASEALSPSARARCFGEQSARRPLGRSAAENRPNAALVSGGDKGAAPGSPLAPAAPPLPVYSTDPPTPTTPITRPLADAGTRSPAGTPQAGGRRSSLRASAARNLLQLPPARF
jgi:hypothetical protein